MILTRIFFSFLILGPILIGLLNLRKYKNNHEKPKMTHYSALLNSAVLYAIAYNVIFFFQELFLVVGKKALGLQSTLYHNNHNWSGQDPMASLMQGSGALAIFIIGLICWAWFQRIRNSRNEWKLLILWLAFHGLIQSIPQVMIAVFDPNTDVGQALVSYLGLNQTVLVGLAILSILAMIVLCIWFSRPLLEIAPDSVDLSNPKMKLHYIRFIVVGAAAVGCVFIIPFRIPPITQLISPFILLVFSIPWIWSVAPRVENVKTIGNIVNNKICWKPIIFLVFLLLIFRIILAPGIEF